jgi:DNA modification methylase
MILVGDALACLRAMPSDSVHCAVTSPPYWGLRDYGVPPRIWGGAPDCRHRWGAETSHKSSHPQQSRNGRGVCGPRDQHPSASCLSQGAFCQRCNAWRGVLGLEPDYRLYVDHLVAVLREVRRVLRPDGTLWLNLGDCYANKGNDKQRDFSASAVGYGGRGRGRIGGQPAKPIPLGLKAKDLVGIPWRVAFALQDDGWWLRRDNVWAKRNPMPESCKDRCTSSHEYLFHLTKSARYFYDAEAIKEEGAEQRDYASWEERKAAGEPTRRGFDAAMRPGNVHGLAPNGGKRNKRSVWSLATSPFHGAHFATFPPALVEPCILAGTSARGVCPSCAAPWKRVVEKAETVPQRSGKWKSTGERHRNDIDRKGGFYPDQRTVGWHPTCKCGPVMPILFRRRCSTRFSAPARPGSSPRGSAAIGSASS